MRAMRACLFHNQGVDTRKWMIHKEAQCSLTKEPQICLLRVRGPIIRCLFTSGHKTMHLTKLPPSPSPPPSPPSSTTSYLCIHSTILTITTSCPPLPSLPSSLRTLHFHSPSPSQISLPDLVFCLVSWFL